MDRNEEIMRRRIEDEEYFAKKERATRIEQTYKWLPLADSSGLQTKTFEQYDRACNPQAFEVVQAFGKELTGVLVLQGPVGVGKTHLLAALCNSLVEADKHPRFVTAPNLFSSLGHMLHNGWDYDEAIHLAGTCDFLVLDDIDKAKKSEFREDVYFAIFDARTVRGLPTAISTNQVDLLPEFVGEASASRLSIGRITARLTGNDYRRRMHSREAK